MDTVDAATLCDEPEKFANQRLKVRGKVYFAGENICGEPMLVFPPTEGSTVLLSACFRRDEKAALERYESGATLVVEGVCAPSRHRSIVQLRDCTLSSVEPSADDDVYRLMRAMLR